MRLYFSHRNTKRHFIMTNCANTSALNRFMSRCDDERRLELLQDAYIDELLSPGGDCDPMRPDNLGDALETADLTALCEYLRAKNHKMVSIELGLISLRYCKDIAEQRAIEEITMESMKDDEYCNYLKIDDKIDYL